VTVICLTGGLSAGKSTAARYLADRGAHVIDADKLGHQAYEPGSQAYREVIAAFGDELIGEDRQIDRRVLGSKVFGKPDELKRLTDIVWPEIRRLAEAEIKASLKSDPHAVVILEAAVLIEAGWQDMGDEVWVTVVDREVAIERCMARDGLSREAVESRLDSQISNEERTARADLVIENNGEADALTAQLDAAWARIRG
jgi:dephospho-CoA kinase